jgi:hypothetical protein
MLRKSILALVAAASLAMLAPTDASARGWGHGGWGGGWPGGGWRGPAIGLGLGLGLAGAYGGYGYPYGGYGYGGYPYGYASYDDGGCYVVRRRVWTSYGWRYQPVQVCGY